MTTQVQSEYKAPSHVAKPGTPEVVVIAAPLVGTWHNVNSSTEDLVKIVIAAAGSNITVNPYGACVPTPCNWGVSPGMAYAPNVSSSQAVAFSSEFTFSFAKVIVVGRLHGKELLVETFTHFTDGSGRSNLYTTDTMTK